LIYQKRKIMEKLTTSNVIELMKQGAILSKHYAVYSYWSLKLTNGDFITNIRKGACNKIQYNFKNNIVLVNNDKNGFSLKFI